MNVGAAGAVAEAAMSPVGTERTSRDVRVVSAAGDITEVAFRDRQGGF